MAGGGLGGFEDFGFDLLFHAFGPPIRHGGGGVEWAGDAKFAAGGNVAVELAAFCVVDLFPEGDLAGGGLAIGEGFGGGGELFEVGGRWRW